MKAVRMTERIEGEYHDGAGWRSWPPPGEIGMFDDGHADGLVASGRGEVVRAEEKPAEKRPAAGTAERRAARPLRDLGTLK